MLFRSVTYWRVDQTPTQHLSIFAHIVDAEGNLVAQRDGLNARLNSLEPGDVVLQHFAIDHPANAAELRLGLYNLRTEQRAPIRGDTRDALQVPLR